MNVLIYSGPTTTNSRASQQLYLTLRSLLSRTYDVKLANTQLLTEQPWSNHTSLLVFPNLEQSEHDSIFEYARRMIRQWVDQGGSYLGIGTGARFAGSNLLGLLDVDWETNQSLFTTISLSEFFTKSFISASESQDSIVEEISIDSQEPSFVIKTLVKDDQLTAWARYANSGGEDQIAGVFSPYGNGRVALAGFEITPHLRRLIDVFRELGLEGLDSLAFGSKDPSALYLVSCLGPDTIQRIHQSILDQCTKESCIEDSQNSFVLTTDIETASQTSPTNGFLQLVLCPDTSPPCSFSLSFNWEHYFEITHQSRMMGKTILFAETVESTQTLLEKNSQLAAGLTSGTVLVASNQTHGRGRGSNNWISTTGSIQFSLLIKTTSLGSGLVFVQYLFGLAVVEWIEKFFKGKLLVRLKWPNDIYGSPSGTALNNFKKMGGILVTCSFGGLSGTDCKIVIGLGLNSCVTPQSKTTSFAELTRAAQQMNDEDDPQHNDLKVPSAEEAIGGILNCFDQMWTRFETKGFEPFYSLYLSRWLHTDQIIKYEKTGQQLKIIGLDRFHGLLQAQSIDPQDKGEIFNLQPDSNSFDMFSGLIKTKV